MDAPPKASLLVNSNPDKMHGTTCVGEWRLSMESFLDHLAGGGNIESYREGYPWVPADDLSDALVYLGEELLSEPLVQNHLREKARELGLANADPAQELARA